MIEPNTWLGPFVLLYISVILYSLFRYLGLAQRLKIKVRSKSGGRGE